MMSSVNASPVFILIWVVCVLGGMVLVCAVLREWMGFTSVAESELGIPLGDSGWGCAKVNGITARNCVKLVKYSDGWLLRNMLIFGGGAIWLPRATTQIGNTTRKGLLGIESVTVNSGNHEIELFGRLAHLVPGAPDTTQSS